MDNEPFEKFAVTFPIAVTFTSPSAIFGPSRVISVIEVLFFRFPFSSEHLDVVGHVRDTTVE